MEHLAYSNGVTIEKVGFRWISSVKYLVLELLEITINLQ